MADTITIYRYKLLRGKHQTGSGDSRKTYKAGDIVETTVKLEEKIPGRFKEKFEPLESRTVVVAAAPDKDADTGGKGDGKKK